MRNLPQNYNMLCQTTDLYQIHLPLIYNLYQYVHEYLSLYTPDLRFLEYIYAIKDAGKELLNIFFPQFFANE